MTIVHIDSAPADVNKRYQPAVEVVGDISESLYEILRCAHRTGEPEFALVWCKGDVLSGLFTADAAVIANSYAYLMGFAPETIATAILFSMVGYFNGNDKTLWVMVQGLVQTLLVRLPMAYIMSIQPNASLTMIGLSAPTSTAVGILLNISFFLWLKRYENQTCA